VDPTHTPRDTLFTPAFIALGVAELAYFTAAGLTVYVLPLFVVGPLGSGEAGAGLAFGAFSVSALLLRPIAGRLADSKGRRPLLIGGAFLCAAATLANAYVDQLAAVVVLRLVLGVAEAAFFVAGFAALADLAPPDRTGEALSFNSLALYLGLALGPILGELLVERGSFAVAWAAGAGLALLAALLAARLPETADLTTPPVGKVLLIHRGSIAPAIGLFSGIAGMVGFWTFASLHAEDVGLHGSSVVLFEFGLVVVLCRILFAKLPDRVPPLRLGAGALATIGMGLLLAATWTTAVGLLVGAGLIAVGVAFTTPAFFSAIFASTKPSERGAAAGTASALLDVAFGGGPMVLGLVASAAGIPWAFAAAATLAISGCLWTIYLSASERRRRSPQPPVPAPSA
jgi:MFS family permease